MITVANEHFYAPPTKKLPDVNGLLLHVVRKAVEWILWTMIKISDYPDGGSLASGDKLVIARGGSNFSIDGSNVGGAGGGTVLSTIWVAG